MFRELAPIMDRLSLLATAASRAATVNKAFGSSLAPHEIDQQFSTEDVDLIIAWMDHKDA